MPIAVGDAGELAVGVVAVVDRAREAIGTGAALGDVAVGVIAVGEEAAVGVGLFAETVLRVIAVAGGAALQAIVIA